MKFEFSAHGHKNVRATHKNTIEFTKEARLTPRGDCIVAVGADNALADLPEALKEKLRAGSKVEIEVECAGVKDGIKAYGHQDLTLKSDECMIIRKSNFICDRTLCINANKGSVDLNRKLIANLQSGLPAHITIRA